MNGDEPNSDERELERGPDEPSGVGASEPSLRYVRFIYDDAADQYERWLDRCLDGG